MSEELATSHHIRAAGLTRVDDRLLALKELATAEPRARTVVEASNRDRFVRVLLAGYDAAGTVAEFIEAEHRSPRVRAFFAMADGSPIAAAAMTVHGDAAVLGGASTLPTHRRQGAQTDLIRHRLNKAAEAGATLAVATARPASASAANLARAGFRLMRQVAFSAL
ncbi:GNAT family N-acetyltransferase [Amycolatopsis acidicola]|uniref:GNAT family N-acetyltransferase n=1 Tax=Amycolatopsis acidicola TaxID=2596893 RepID=A0A5N0ULJ6_9PSEU|nr:GNAT family N-acetyltransferase [Amycolatopsis acidicola]KAA9150785.1 GNAT family N-acetyltransferase [Amycolatopsis acidicola]